MAEEHSDAMLMAYADGELDAEATAAIAAAARRDPRLAARIDAFRRSRAAVQAAFAGVIAEPVPERLRDAAAPGATVLPFRPKAAPPARWRSLAIAASVAGVALLGGYLAGRQGAGPAPSLLAAAPGLVEALETAPSGGAGGGPRITASHRVPDGVCRSFEIPASQVRGLACDRGAGWQVELAVAASAGMTPASDRATAAIDAALDAIGAGAPIGAEEEAALRARRWGRAAGR